MATERIHGFCALCWSRCGCISTVEDGRLVAVEPDPEHPTGKALCGKGRAAPELVHHPDRLLHPLKRTRPKGEADPGWERIGWDEALDTIADTLNRLAKESGSETVAFGITTTAGTAMQDGFVWVERLRRAFGSPNAAIAMELCGFAKEMVFPHTFGVPMPVADLAQTDCFILWGHNPSTTWLAHATRIADAKARGAKLVVIDPRSAGLANKADQWLRVRPGSDGALALGLAGVMIEEGRFDREFVTRWTNGPFLVRDDTGQLLTGADLDEGGDAAQRIAWDASTGARRFATTRRAAPTSERMPTPCSLAAMRSPARKARSLAGPPSTSTRNSAGNTRLSAWKRSLGCRRRRYERRRGSSAHRSGSRSTPGPGSRCWPTRARPTAPSPCSMPSPGASTPRAATWCRRPSRPTT